MDNDISATPPTLQTPSLENTPVAKNKITTPIIVIIALVIIGGGYFVYQKWQRQRAVNTFLNELGVTETGLFNSNIDKIAQEIAKEEAEQTKKTPAEKFASAEIINIADNNHGATADLINNIVENAYGDSKITGFTSGYMGMNSGSGIIQFMVPITLAMNDINPLKEGLENNNFEIISTSQQNDSVSIMAQKNDTSYTFGFNSGDQEIMVVIINMGH